MRQGKGGEVRVQADHTLAHKALERVVRDYLHWCGCWEFKVAGGLFQRAGLPDILGCIPPSGRLLGVEIKTGVGKVTALQRQQLEAIATAGGLALVIASVEDLEDALLRENLLKAPLLVTRQQAAAWRAARLPPGL